MRKEVDPLDEDQWRTDTAERPAVGVPPPPAQPYAPVPPPTPASRPTPSPTPTIRSARPPARRPERTPLPGWVAWLIVGLLLVTAAVVGAQLVLQPPGTPTAVDQSDGTEPEPSSDEASGQEQGDEKAEPADPEASDDEPAESLGELVSLNELVTATVPGAAPANNDVTGERVTFTADNLLDGDPETCWRIAGDATGAVLTFTFSEPVTVQYVGLINGYAKTSFDAAGRAFDWYQGNRRVLRVEWTVGDETFVQDLGQVSAHQDLPIPPTETTEVRLRLVDVTPPGAGPTGRDYTALSAVAFGGYRA